MKPTVEYINLQTILDPETIGKRVVLFPLNHPNPSVSNTTYTVTSVVLSYTEDGIVETENTIYVPRQVEQTTSGIQPESSTETSPVSAET